jgi:hypothetical protein
MSIRPWLKLRQSYIDDPALGALPEEIQLRFYKLYMLAGQYELDGVIPLTPAQIAWKLRISEDELQRTFNALPHEYFSNNGNGVDVTIFRREQAPQSAFEKQQEENRERQARFQEKRRPVTNALVTPLESESESDQESESESESESDKSPSSQSSPVQDRPAATDRTDVWNSGLTRLDFLKLCGIPSRLAAQLANDSEIGEVDILAELARNYARKGTGKGQVTKPGTITGMNLIKHELPDSDWYQPLTWENNLPRGMLEKIGLVSAEDKIGMEELSITGYTKAENVPLQPDSSVNQVISGTALTPTQLWETVLEQMRSEMPKASFDMWLRDTIPCAFSEGLLTVGARNSYARDWLESRLSQTLEQASKNTCGQSIKISFVATEETPA